MIHTKNYALKMMLQLRYLRHFVPVRMAIHCTLAAVNSTFVPTWRSHGRHLPAERKYNSHGCDSRAVRGQNSVCGRGRNSFCQLQRHNPHERLPFREYDGRCLQHSRHIYARCQKAILHPCSAPFRSFSAVWSEYFQKGR